MSIPWEGEVVPPDKKPLDGLSKAILATLALVAVSTCVSQCKGTADRCKASGGTVKGTQCVQTTPEPSPR